MLFLVSLCVNVILCNITIPVIVDIFQQRFHLNATVGSTDKGVYRLLSFQAYHDSGDHALFWDIVLLPLVCFKSGNLE
jgi:hypothetical protein